MEPLTVPGDLSALGAIRDYVKHAAEQAQLDRKATYRLTLAVDEVATNVITHGYEEAGLTGDLTVRAVLESGALTVVLEDRAVPFNPLEQPSPNNLDQPLEDRDIGGLGIYLTVQGVDAFRYEWRDGHNRNIFVMNAS